MEELEEHFVAARSHCIDNGMKLPFIVPQSAQMVACW